MAGGKVVYLRIKLSGDLKKKAISPLKIDR